MSVQVVVKTSDGAGFELGIWKEQLAVGYDSGLVKAAFNHTNKIIDTVDYIDPETGKSVRNLYTKQ